MKISSKDKTHISSALLSQTPAKSLFWYMCHYKRLTLHAKDAITHLPIRASDTILEERILFRAVAPSMRVRKLKGSQITQQLSDVPLPHFLSANWSMSCASWKSRSSSVSSSATAPPEGVTDTPPSSLSTLHPSRELHTLSLSSSGEAESAQTHTRSHPTGAAV